MEKFRNYVGLVLCLCIVTTVSTAQRKVETVAEKVMLFIDGAQVTRTKRVDIPAGNSALLFTGLSPYLDARSMQVSAKGKLTITNVNLQYNFLDSVAVGRKQEQLQQTLKKIEKQQEERKAALAVVKAGQEVLKNNCTIGGKSNALTMATVREATTCLNSWKMLLKKWFRCSPALISILAVMNVLKAAGRTVRAASAGVPGIGPGEREGLETYRGNPGGYSCSGCLYRNLYLELLC